MKYRIYIDESGDTHPATTNDKQRRYLSLTGVILKRDYADWAFQSSFDELRERHFAHGLFGPVVLHRRTIIAKEGPFSCLKNEKCRAAWDRDFLSFLRNSEFWVITSCIDKVAFYYRYPTWERDPYSMCILNLLERYFYFLERNGGQSDIFADQRNPRDDKILCQAYREFYLNGSDHISADKIQRRLVSPHIDFKSRKKDDIPGLQLADLLAKPSHSACLFLYAGIDEFTDYARFVARIIEKGKYYRRFLGSPDGYGRIWRPALKRLPIGSRPSQSL